MDLLVLGPVEVRNQGEPVSIGGPKQRSIMALLVAEAGHPVSVDRIIEDVYGEDAPEGVRRSVQTLVSLIRRELGDIVQPAAGGYVLMVEAEAIDAVRFENEVRSALPMVETDPEQAANALRDALAMWRGHPYSDIDSRAVLEPEITRLRELRLTALEARIDADLALGRHRELTGELEALTVEHPLREKFRGQHMLALYRSGRQTEALRGFERTRFYLADEIGIIPSKELADLEQRILEQDPGLDLPAAPSVTQRAVLVVELSGGEGSARMAESEREAITETLALIEETVESIGGEGTQRGSAVYASFARVDEAVVAIQEVMSTAGRPGILPRASIDYGDIERHDSGEVAGPPVRRGAGLVAAAHPGQVLLSAEANQALSAIGASGSLVKSLGTHRIQGVEASQPIFQVILVGHDAEFPPLLFDANPPPLPTDRRAVAGYELREPIISDLAGTTYRAFQPSAGREVEITVIDPAWAGEPAFVSRFEVETQHIGRLQHPHVLLLLDHWRDPAGAYLVTMWLGGGTLTDRVARGHFDLEHGRRLITQLGSALSYAHQEGIVHGAISPGAVSLDPSGNGYLSTARLVVRLTGAPQIHSKYLAPECGRGESLTAVSDVFGLGRLTADILGIEGRLGEVIEVATADLPADRYPSVDEFISAVDGAIGLAVPQLAVSTLRNPYKGLAAFEESDSGDFFGRSEVVSELIRLLANRKLVAVVGPSGSGKSSLVHAGLIPAVRAGALDGAHTWVVAAMFPGSYPLDELESALSRVAVADPGALIDELENDDRGLSRVIKRILPADTRLLLVIDQFEELFTLTHDEVARNRLLSALVNLASDERSDTRVVLTMRADFFDRPLQYPEFGELLKNGIVPLTIPTDDELIDAIERPAEVVGASWEPGLPEQILADVSGSPGTLPLLQYSLTELFAARIGDRLTHDVYQQNGGVLGALAGRAEEAFARLDASQQALARQVFLRLVTVRSAGEATRRRARLVELNAIGDAGEVRTVLDTFGEARLLVFDRDPISRSPTAEVAHEALITSWPRLAGWLEEASEDLLLHSRLRDALAEWEDRDREDGYLLTGGRLAQFDTWAASTDLTLAPSEIEYLGASREESHRQRSGRRRRRNLITAGFGAAAVIAGIFAFSATRNAGIAESRELAASAINVLDEDPELSVLLALEAAGVADPPIESVSAIHESLAAHHQIFTYQLPADLDDPVGVLSPDGDLLSASRGGNYIEVSEVDSGKRLWSREFGEGAIVGVGFSPDGSDLVATVGWERSDESPIDPQLNGELGAHTFDARTGALIDYLPIEPCGLVSAPAMVIGPGAGSHLLADISSESDCTYDAEPFDVLRGSMSFLDLASGEIEVLADEGRLVLSTLDGSRLIIESKDSDGEPLTRVVDRPSGREVAVLPRAPWGISFDGTIVLTDSYEGSATWDVSAGQPAAPLVTTEFSIGAWLSPDGNTLARLDGPAVDLVDSRTGEVERVLLTGFGTNGDVSFSTDGSRVAVNGLDTTVVFDQTQGGELGRNVKLCDQMGPQSGYVDVRGDTASVFACGEDGANQYLLNPETLEIRAEMPNQGGRRSALSPDGRFVASQSGRVVVTHNGEEVYLIGEIVVRDTATGKIVQTMDGLCEWLENEPWGPDSEWGKSCVAFPDTPFPDWPWDLVFSPDGSMLAISGQRTPAVVVGDTRTGEIIGMPSVPHITTPDNVLNATFSPSGDRLVASLGHELWMFSTEDWGEVAQYLSPATGAAPVDNLTFTPDGEILIGTGLAHIGPGDIVFMDGNTLEYIYQIPNAHPGGVSDLALNEDGSLLASAGVDGLVRVWDVATRSLLHQIPVSPVGDGVGGVGFVGDTGHLLVTALETGELHKVTSDTEELLGIARSRVTRGFTETECNTYRIDPCPSLEEIRAG